MLVIIPGWMHAAKQWDTVSMLLKQQNVEHVVLDLPGFGTVPADTTITTLADLTVWCNQQILEIQSKSESPLIIVGHSCGGRIGLQLVAEGLSAQELILIGSPNLYRPSLQVQLIKLLVAIFRPIKSIIPKAVRKQLRSDDYTAAQGTLMNDLYKSVIKDDQTALLSNTTTNVTLLWGENDTAAPVRIAHEMHAKLPTSELAILPNLGHNLHQENPQLLAGKLVKYVQAT